MDKEQYYLLLGLANDFLDSSKGLGTAALSEGLEDVFGAMYWDNAEAMPFRSYFSDIENYELALRDGNPEKIDKPMPPPFSGHDSMDVDGQPESAQLSNATLQASTLSIEAERTERLIRNVSPHQNQKQGRKLNDLSARLVIERKQGAKTVTLYCIGCLKKSANKATDRLHKHAITCNELARDFPDELKEVQNELENKSTPVVLENDGKGALRIRSNPLARKAADPYYKRTPVDGISPFGPGTSSTSTPEPSSSFTSTPEPPSCPSYAVPDRSSFFIKHIAAETAYVLKLLKVFLAQFIHLTLSFDGWSSKKGDEIYTVHITTPNRMSFLVEGLVLTGISTSAENIFNRLLTLNLLAKDLVLGSKTWPKIKAFSKVMVIVNALTNYFSHSNYGKHHLKNAMKESKDRRGIEAGGATRFPHSQLILAVFCVAFHSWNSAIPLGQLPLIPKAMLKSAPKKTYLSYGAHSNWTTTQPHRRALKTLEDNKLHAPSFLYLHWFAVAFQRAFNDPKLRASLLFHMALKLNLPPRSTFSKETAPQMARDLIRYARHMLANEQLREQEGGPEEGEVLVKQLIAYMYREAPFNDPCTKPLFRLSWWQARINNSDANQLPVSASEMCDERTASKMAAWSTAKKNGLAADYIINMGILEKYWKYGFSTANIYNHISRLALETFDETTTPPPPI
ncbi:hypothetical protein B0H10DRAFT_2332021 [Mycena sp. CBHHK59/15]|nr:hypothetical protein B0H10DRAFT_2332021 [Mycena sp. CBHHK59/15]